MIATCALKILPFSARMIILTRRLLAGSKFYGQNLYSPSRGSSTDGVIAVEWQLLGTVGLPWHLASTFQTSMLAASAPMAASLMMGSTSDSRRRSTVRCSSVSPPRRATTAPPPWLGSTSGSRGGGGGDDGAVADGQWAHQCCGGGSLGTTGPPAGRGG
mmetsp:Transcript_168874/g.542811  ORF Transcript_168874/g.542811 Transcript_168874/m.542811 type:complete len:159 (-) Transcript_168874:1426-1902(-)